TIAGENELDGIDVWRISVVDPVGVKLRLAERPFNGLVRTLRLGDKQREAGTPDGVVWDVTDALACALVDLRRLHVLLGSDPLVRDVQEGWMQKEWIDELLVDVTLGLQFREISDGDL